MRRLLITIILVIVSILVLCCCNKNEQPQESNMNPIEILPAEESPIKIIEEELEEENNLVPIDYENEEEVLPQGYN